MFKLECMKCKNKGLIKENNINEDADGNALDCMTEIVSDGNKFEIGKNTHGMSIKCNNCGQMIMSYDSPY